MTKNLEGFTRLVDELPKDREMVIFIAESDAFRSQGIYQTDPYCGRMNSDGSFARWPHDVAPTHFKRIWEKDNA